MAYAWRALRRKWPSRAGTRSAQTSVSNVAWPEFDPALCVDDVLEIAVQVNGKVRGRAALARDASETAAREAALADPNVTKFLDGKAIKKLVYVPGKILNFIVA